MENVRPRGKSINFAIQTMIRNMSDVSIMGGAIVLDDPRHHAKIPHSSLPPAWYRRNLKPRRKPFNGRGHRGLGGSVRRNPGYARRWWSLARMDKIIYGIDFASVEARYMAAYGNPQNIPRNLCPMCEAGIPLTTGRSETLPEYQELPPRLVVNIGTVGHVDHGKTTLTAAVVRAIGSMDQFGESLRIVGTACGKANRISAADLFMKPEPPKFRGRFIKEGRRPGQNRRIWDGSKRSR